MAKQQLTINDVLTKFDYTLNPILDKKENSLQTIRLNEWDSPLLSFRIIGVHINEKEFVFQFCSNRLRLPAVLP